MFRPVLVVEDHDATLSLLCTLLGRRLGCACTSATTVDAARDAIRTGEFVAVVIDGTIRDRDGTLLVEWIAREFPEHCQRVIAVTAEPPGTGIYRRIASTEPCALLAKPFDIDHLVTAVMQCMRPAGGLPEGEDVSLPA